MASAIRVPHQPEPSPRAHPVDVAAERRLVHLKQFGQFGGPGLLSIGDRNEHAELAGLQSGAGQRSVIDRRDHAIQLADATTDANAFDTLDLGHVYCICMHSPRVKSRQPETTSLGSNFAQLDKGGLSVEVEIGLSTTGIPFALGIP